MDRIIIIGGGLGGLFTGALLAKEGYEVTVLEKNTQIGGGLQTFYRKGIGFESGMHLLGGIRKGGSIYKICRYLGIMEQMDIRDVDHDCMDQITYLSDGKTYYIPEGKDAFTAYFQQLFPSEAEGIRQYVDALFGIVDEIDFFYLRTGNDHIYSHRPEFLWPADQLVAHYIHNQKLRDILSYMNPMFGGYEGHTPAYIHALINVLYINGPSRFAGNSQQMADALKALIEKAGGKVLGGEKVVKIDLEDRLMTAVHTQKGNTYTADKFIAAIHPAVMLQMTDSKAFSRAYRTRIQEASNSYSSFCVYVIFKPHSFPFINHTCYYQSDYGMVWHYDEYDASDFPRGFLYMTPCEKEQGEFATKMIINSIMPYSACAKFADTFTGRRGEEYEAWKQQHIDKVLAKMELLYPGFREQCDTIFASSPLTIRDYYNEPEGALYGLHKDCENIAESQVPVYTKVRNLYMTGQNVNLHGFCGVPLTAINTAEAIVGINKIVDKINAYDAMP
jgi:all-trans-retinol 13,14-reductase